MQTEDADVGLPILALFAFLVGLGVYNEFTRETRPPIDVDAYAVLTASEPSYVSAAVTWAPR